MGQSINRNTTKLKSMITMIIAANASLVMVLASCTNQAENINLGLIQDAQKIVSTRAQNQNSVMAIVKLKSPALLESATHIQGVTQIDSKLADQIQKEQEQAIKDIQALSPDVQVVYRYRLVLNAVCILAPKSVLEKLGQVGLVASWENVGVFERPEPASVKPYEGSTDDEEVDPTLNEKNSSIFIGAQALNKAGLTGKGIKVGIIDTGIDYTHSMFKGVGTADAYKAINPATPALGFPSDKVVGGVDLVGTDYDSASAEFLRHIPKPDLNPLDEGGHGTHVAGTVAGLGDGLRSYNGMAPDAQLYAIKVFGRSGSTSDMVVIAGLEYAANPKGDLDLHDQLDVVNLSLGSGYGNPKILYSEALKNLVRAGTVAVISAGNSGNKDYIVGAPGTTTEALSVAASIDDGEHNWKFSASDIVIDSQTVTVEAIEAVSTLPIKKAHVVGDVVYVGLAKEDLNDDLVQAVKGKVALIDRGVVPFNDKVARAVKAGAIGVIVANHSPGAAFKMGTSDPFNIPAIMVTQDVGQKMKQNLAAGKAVSIRFYSDKKIEKPELIDNLTSFSSKGPRSIDGFLKPEISAPGSDIISAAMGKGDKPVQMSGTSMAAPHVAGVMALLKQSYKDRQIDMSALELKNVAMGTAKTIGEAGERYPVTRQGAGRVQADKAAQSLFVAEEPSVSFGETAVESKKSMRSVLHLRNLSKEEQTLTIEFSGNEFLTLSSAGVVKLSAAGISSVPLVFTLDATKMKEESVREMDGFILFKKAGVEVYRVPVLAVAHRLSAVQAQNLVVKSSSADDSEGALVTLDVNNTSRNSGDLYVFNMIGHDLRKPIAPSFMNSDCDLQNVGYRIFQRQTKVGTQKFVQFAIKTYKPMTTWNSCDVSLLVNSQKKGLPEQEILGSSLKSIPGQSSEEFATTVLDAAKTRDLRAAFEKAIADAKNDTDKLAKLKDTEKYDAAILDQQDMKIFNNSTVMILEVQADVLKTDDQGRLNFQVVLTHNEQSSVRMDDIMGGESDLSKATYYTISLDEKDQAFIGVDEVYSVSGNSNQTLNFEKGRGQQNLFILMPQNKFTFSQALDDAQGMEIAPVYKAD